MTEVEEGYEEECEEGNVDSNWGAGHTQATL